MTSIASDLLARIAERANDPLRRTYMAGARASAPAVNMQNVFDDLMKHGSPQAKALLGGFGNFQKLLSGMPGGLMMMGPGGPMRMGGEAEGPQPLAATPSAAALADAERRIGRALPDGVKQLYAIGDGGFGPADGLFPLAELIERYEDMTAEPYGPAGQDWPKNLLPMFNENPVLLCIDMESGAIVAWDPEEIEDEDSEADWQRSFKSEEESLAALMEKWLGEPTLEQRMEQERREAFGKVPQVTLDYYAAMTPEQRASHGLPGDDWEAELRRRFAAGPGA
jgi:hypothetical protein